MECGAQIRQQAELCPECGVRQDGAAESESDDDTLATAALAAGAFLSLVSLVFLPILFGPLAMLCGILAIAGGRHVAGVLLTVWAAIATMIGMVIGMAVMLL